MSANERSGDIIHIEQLELASRIGVPDEERAEPQRLTLSITMWPRIDFRRLEDEVANTIDYAAVCREVKELVSGRSDKLVETLAEAIAAKLLRSFPIQRVRVELRKFILPDVKHVAVVIVREPASGT